MSSKRELVLKAFKGEAVDRVPVGFWHHFTTEEEFLLDQTVEGGRDYGLEFSPVLPYLDLFLLSPDCLLEQLY